jgi:predicted nucleotidyltransferase
MEKGSRQRIRPENQLRKPLQDPQVDQKSRRPPEAVTLIPIMGIINPIMGIRHTSGIGEALYGRTRQAVLRLFFGRPDQRFLQKEVIGHIGLGSGTVQRELERLWKAEILVRSVEGRQKYFQANPKNPIFEELRRLVRKTFGLTHVIQEALAPIARRIDLAFIFGSVANGTENSSSDVDLMVVSDAVSLSDLIPSIRRAEDELGREVNPSLYSLEEFRRKLAEGQNFLAMVVGGPKIFVIGDEDELRRLAEIWLVKTAQNESERGHRTVGRRRS